MQKERAVLTIEEVASLLRCSTKSIKRWSKAGTIPSPIAPSRWSAEQIHRLLAGQNWTVLDIAAENSCNKSDHL